MITLPQPYPSSWDYIISLEKTKKMCCGFFFMESG